MQLRWLTNEFKYDGSQLRSLFAYLDHGVLGNSVLAWVGPCEVTVEHMVDGEDLNNQAAICGDKMLHLIIEYFEGDLYYGVALQRILASQTIDILREHSSRDDLTSELSRHGDDVFVGGKKMSISVATRSPLSTLVHFAVNVVNDGTPVDTISLSDFQVDAPMFAKLLMQNITHEIESIKDATRKVKWVK